MGIIFMNRVWIHRLGIAGLWYWLPLAVATAAPQADSTGLQYRMATYTFEALVEEGAVRKTVELAYPVFVGGDLISTRRMNGQLRRIALETYFNGDEEGSLARALKMTDRQVVKELGAGTGGVEQSVLRPDRALGTLRTFTLYTSTLGLARSYSSVSGYMYDIQAGREVLIETLFNPGSDAALTQLFDKEKVKGFPSCSRRSFEWKNLGIRDLNQVSLAYPYDPAESAECGDGFYLLKGPQVRRLLKDPQALLPEYKLIELR